MATAVHKDATTMYSAEVTYNNKEHENALHNLMESGEALKNLFNINQSKIKKALEEIREEWK